jgi:hypothetical protein
VEEVQDAGKIHVVVKKSGEAGEVQLAWLFSLQKALVASFFWKIYGCDGTELAKDS